MLILGRHENQTIFIEHEGKTVEIVVVEIRGDTVKLGIQAPAEVVIYRDDCKNRERRERETA